MATKQRAKRDSRSLKKELKPLEPEMLYAQQEDSVAGIQELMRSEGIRSVEEAIKVTGFLADDFTPRQKQYMMLESMPAEAFPKDWRSNRSAGGLSLRAIATAIGVSEQMVHQWRRDWRMQQVLQRINFYRFSRIIPDYVEVVADGVKKKDPHALQTMQKLVLAMARNENQRGGVPSRQSVHFHLPKNAVGEVLKSLERKQKMSSE